MEGEMEYQGEKETEKADRERERTRGEERYWRGEEGVLTCFPLKLGRFLIS